MKRIGIIGCGWLGLPLLHHLQNQGYHIFGTIRSVPPDAFAPIFQWDGMSAMDEKLQQQIRQCDGLVVTIPPQRERDIEGNRAFHLAIAKELARLNESMLVIYTSSTSVYGELEGEVVEKDADRSSRAYAIEKAYLQCFEQTTLVRFGGLIGPGRDPHHFFNPGSEIPKPNQWVNMTHLNDAISSIHHLLRLQSNGVFNVVSPHPTSRLDFYSAAFNRHHSRPSFGLPAATAGKRINSDKIQNLTGYNFSYPSILDALNSIEVV
jgi:nucleoside-diphosphate-sugar epimerase